MMDDIQSVITFFDDEITWLEEQKASTDTIMGEIYKEIDGEKRIQTMKTAISAMQELQQYRATGLTPRMVKELVVNDKRNHKLAVQRATELDEYQIIGTVEECREAREKQQPMNVTEIHVDEYYCPACRSENGCDQRIVRDKYCPECGQALKTGGIGADVGEDFAGD